MKIYTIGFTKKSAEEFFEILEHNKIKIILDIRLNNTSQLSGFAKGKDLKFFLKRILDIFYIHDLNLAPTKDILFRYKKNMISWESYESEFLDLLNERNIREYIKAKYIKNLDGLCLLCSEHEASKCHRRLVAEFIKNEFVDMDIEIVHL